MATGENIISALELVRDAVCDLTQELAATRPGEQPERLSNAEVRLERQGKTLEGVLRRLTESERRLKDVEGTVRLMIAVLGHGGEELTGQGPDDRAAASPNKRPGRGAQ